MVYSNKSSQIFVVFQESMMMKVLAFGIAIAAIGVAPAFANVDPKIAEFCLKAQDFQGCVNSMSGKKPEATDTTIRQVQQQGANLSEGNYCPAQHIYSGGGYCQSVKCFSGGLFGKGHSEDLAGKGMSCANGQELRWSGDLVRASFNKKCPPYEPEVGYMSSCHEAQHTGFVRIPAIGFKRDKSGFIEEILGGAAEEIGLLYGDIVVTVNGASVNQINKNPEKHKLEVGDKFEIVVRRKGKTLTFNGITTLVKFPLKVLQKEDK